MLDKRLETANTIIAVFQKHPKVRHAFLRGSLNKFGFADDYSDIDIGIDVSGFDNGDFAQQIPSLMQKNFDILFYDWSTSLFPKEYVLTFILKGFPVFWIVDIQCIATPHSPSINQVLTNEYHHLLKLWILNLKYYLRGNNGAEDDIRKLANKVFDSNMQHKDSFLLMSDILLEIKTHIEPETLPFIERCEEELKLARELLNK